jgi:hypothetical protein
VTLGKVPRVSPDDDIGFHAPDRASAHGDRDFGLAEDIKIGRPVTARLASRVVDGFFQSYVDETHDTYGSGLQTATARSLRPPTHVARAAVPSRAAGARTTKPSAGSIRLSGEVIATLKVPAFLRPGKTRRREPGRLSESPT